LGHKEEIRQKQRGRGMDPNYSFVVPVYNEEENLHELYRRIVSVMNRMEGTSELILINDGSRDGSLQFIRGLHQQDQRVCYLSLARNFGHQIAVTAGLNFARGQAVVVMDADLQDPPELVLEMVKVWRQGYEIVYAQRTHRHGETLFKRLCASLFYRFLNRLSDVEIPHDTGDFCLMDHRVVALLNKMPERHRFIRGLRSWVGFRQTFVRFEREGRFAGKPKYTFRKSLMLAMNGIVSFSRVPLRLFTLLGLLAAGVAILMMLLVLYWRIFVPHSPLIGFASIATIVFFLGAVQLVGIGVLGEYVGRIFEEIKGRPLYTLEEVGGFLNQPLSRLPSRREFATSFDPQPERKDD
jgi:glycosyltransferase involved in cell wall biosynthesis